MKSILISILIITSLSSIAQSFEYVYRDPRDSSYNAYLIVLPDTEIRGLLVRDYTTLPIFPEESDYPYQWRKLALENGLLVLYTQTTKTFPELYYTDDGLYTLDEIIHEVVSRYTIPVDNIFMGGISASGTRALKYAQFCEAGKSKFNLKINGVFSVDSPLDYERFYRSAVAHKKFFKGGMLWEANYMPLVFESAFGGSAYDVPEVYQKASVYSYRDSLGGNAKYLMNTALLFFHEPDINWWIEERGATYYDINSYDIAGLVNQLRYFGHPDVESILTTGKGLDAEGNRKCHSWTIVDEEYLINWIISRLH